MRVLLHVFLVLILSCSLASESHGQHSSKHFPDDPKLDSLIVRFNSDSLKCLAAVDAFRDYRDHHTKDPRAWLYLGRAYDKVGSFVGVCEFSDTTVFLYVDSALAAFKLAESMQPGIQEAHFGFTVPQLIGHMWGTRVMWAMKMRDLPRMRLELQKTMALGGFPGKLLDVARLSLQSLPPNAILFASGDDFTFPFWYVQFVEHVRQDVAAINLSLFDLFWYQNLYREGLPGAIQPVYFPKIGDIDSRDYDDRVVRLIDSESVFSKAGNGEDTIQIDRSAIERWRKMLPDVQIPSEVITTAFRVRYHFAEGNGPLSDLAILRIIKSNKWKRPIYFSSGCRFDEFQTLSQDLYHHLWAAELLPVDLTLRSTIKSDMGKVDRVDRKEAEQLLQNPKWTYSLSADTISGQVVNSFEGQFILNYLRNLLHLDQFTLGGLMPKIRDLLQGTAPRLSSGYFMVLQYLSTHGFDAQTGLDWGISSLRKWALAPTRVLQYDHYSYAYLLALANRCEELGQFITSINWASKEIETSPNHKYYNDNQGVAKWRCPDLLK
jgi:hypothetical protein